MPRTGRRLIRRSTFDNLFAMDLAESLADVPTGSCTADGGDDCPVTVTSLEGTKKTWTINFEVGADNPEAAKVRPRCPSRPDVLAETDPRRARQAIYAALNAQIGDVDSALLNADGGRDVSQHLDEGQTLAMHCIGAACGR